MKTEQLTIICIILLILILAIDIVNVSDRLYKEDKYKIIEYEKEKLVKPSKCDSPAFTEKYKKEVLNCF